MQKIISNPNCSIVLPGICNAHCKFCFWKHTMTYNDQFIPLLTKHLDSLPDQFTKISITGGEPFLSPYLFTALDVINERRDKFHKVVLTSNGTVAFDTIKLLREHFDDDVPIDYVNFSRHHYDPGTNNIIFGQTMPDSLADAIKELNQIGIPVSFNCVLDETKYTKWFVPMFIDFAKEQGVSRIAFRRDHDCAKEVFKDPTKFEQDYEHYWATFKSECPVCRTKGQLIDGMTVDWMSSFLEPTEILADTIYEVIVHPDGRMTSDWNGVKEV